MNKKPPEEKHLRAKLRAATILHYASLGYDPKAIVRVSELSESHTRKILAALGWGSMLVSKEERERILAEREQKRTNPALG